MLVRWGTSVKNKGKCRHVALAYLKEHHRLESTLSTVMILVFGQTGLGKQCRPRSDCSLTVCKSVYILWTHYSKVKPLCSYFSVITANFPVFDFFFIWMVFVLSCLAYSLLVNEPQHNKVTSVPSKDSGQPAQADLSFCCPFEEALGPWLPIKRIAKSLLRLAGCQG